MPIGTKQGDVWRTPTGVFVRVAGTWRRVNLVHVRVAGEWQIAFADAFSFTLSGNLTDVNLRTAALAAGWNEVAAVTCTIPAGTVINATGNYALTINGSFPNGVTLVNNGLIVGRGGNGGEGGHARGDFGTGPNLGIAYGGVAGSPGGHALLAQVPVTVINNGTIAGGGGGGGGGGSTIANQIVDDGSGGGGGK